MVFHFDITTSHRKGELRLNKFGYIRMSICSNGFVGINILKPETTLDVNGTITTKQIIIENETGKQDLIALINQLQQKVTALEQQLTALAKN